MDIEYQVPFFLGDYMSNYPDYANRSVLLVNPVDIANDWLDNARDDYGWESIEVLVEISATVGSRRFTFGMSTDSWRDTLRNCS